MIREIHSQLPIMIATLGFVLLLRPFNNVQLFYWPENLRYFFREPKSPTMASKDKLYQK